MARLAIRSRALWLCVVVLLVNDHLLKGSGLLPGGITGKLSDFAWLVVAPSFAGALLGLQTRRAVATLIAAITGLFIATELSQGLADEVAGLATALGLPSRLWADPTDLIALSVLPLTWHVMTQSGRIASDTEAKSAMGVLGRVGMGLGIFASIATTNPPPRDPFWTTGAFVVNRTGGALDVRVRWTDALVDCDALESAPIGTAVSGVIFEDAITYRLVDGETVPLERADPMAPSVPPMLTGTCQLAMVSIDGAPDTIVVVPGTSVAVMGMQRETLEQPGRAVVATLRAPGFDLTVGSELRWGLRDDRLRVTDCERVGEVMAFSTSVPVFGAEMITERTDGSDGCVALTTTSGARAFVCAPAELVPFVPGDEISAVRRMVDGELVQGLTSASWELTLGARADGGSVGPLALAVGPTEACSGVRTTCGAFSQPVQVDVTDATASVLASPSGIFSSSAGARLALGRTESIVIAPRECDAEHRALGTVIQYALLRPL